MATRHQRLGEERDPIAGLHEEAGTFTMPQAPARWRVADVTAFNRVRGGGYRFMPSLTSTSPRLRVRDNNRLVQPVAYMSALFGVKPEWLKKMRRQHDRAVAVPNTYARGAFFSKHPYDHIM